MEDAMTGESNHQVAPIGDELAPNVGKHLAALAVAQSERVEAVAVEFGRHVVRHVASGAARRQVVSEMNHLAELGRDWVTELMRTPRERHLGADLPEGLRRLPPDCLHAGISLIRRRWVALAIDTAHGSGDLGQVVDAIERIMDLQLLAACEPHLARPRDRMDTNDPLALGAGLAASIGHELRNPLATIETSAYLLTQRLGKVLSGEEGVFKHLDKIRGQVRNATEVVDAIMGIVRQRPPNCRVVVLASVIEAAVTQLRLADGVRVETTLGADLTVWADPTQLGIILSNLLRNAVEALAGRGTIDLKAKEHSGGVEILVRDNGPGIPSAHLDQIFEPSFTTKSRGHGLGLPLCRRMAVAHGGTLALQPCDSGACFRLWLPGAPTEASASAH